MTETKPEHYKVAYNRLYGYIRHRHPEVLQEYRDFIQKAKDDAINNLGLLSEGD